jgi:hypothetical protein
VNGSEIARGIQEIWQNKPGVIVLLLLGFVVFLFLVLDAWLHKKRRKKPR